LCRSHAFAEDVKSFAQKLISHTADPSGMQVEIPDQPDCRRVDLNRNEDGLGLGQWW
jgi:hypothetical protein